MMSRALGAALAVGGLCASTQAAVFFTFEDPGSGPEITYTEGTDNNSDPGVLSYTGAQVNLIVDGNEEGLGTINYSASLEMEILIGAVEGEINNILSAPILGGTFTFTNRTEGDNGGDVILSGSMTNGGLLTLNTVGALIATSTTAGLTMDEGPVLAAFLGGLELAPTFDISFTLTNISPGTTKNQENFITSFTANSAFTGNANVIPTPGTALLASASFSLLATRRKRG